MQQEENFDSLRRALKLKRHEQPPPGYFKNFSALVVNRIRENDVHDRATTLDEASWEAPWITRILAIFQAKPAFAGVVAGAACVLMIGAIVYSERPPVSPALAASPVLGEAANIQEVGLKVAPANDAGFAASANPVGALPAGTTLFDKLRPQNGSVPVFSTTNLLK